MDTDKGNDDGEAKRKDLTQRTRRSEHRERREQQRQKRPPKGGRYKFNANSDGWRSEDRRYELKIESNEASPCGLLLLLCRRLVRLCRPIVRRRLLDFRRLAADGGCVGGGLRRADARRRILRHTHSPARLGRR